MHKNATKCNETLSKWCKNKHGASKIIDTFETYQVSPIVAEAPLSPLVPFTLLPPEEAPTDDSGGVPLFSLFFLSSLS
jgi:hypothetical protein